MEEFVLIFRQPLGETPLTTEQMQARMKLWENWFGNIAAQGRYMPGKRLADGGKVLKQSGLITDGPFVEIKEQLLGFISVKAENMDEAITLAHGCPIFGQGGTVEIRTVIPTNY